MIYSLYSKAKEKILEKYPNIKDITNIKIIKEEDKKNKISLNLFVTCLEDITEYQENEIKNSFPDYTIYRAFTSNMIIKKLLKLTRSFLKCKS